VRSIGVGRNGDGKGHGLVWHSLENENVVVLTVGVGLRLVPLTCMERFWGS
jgi:hypothetical protein